jgi:hypothetical protein
MVRGNWERRKAYFAKAGLHDVFTASRFLIVVLEELLRLSAFTLSIPM